jgi:trans-aconitate methyltransferase
LSADWLSDEYAGKSIVQRGAAGKLLRVLDLRGDESILDAGCGPGHITALLAGATTGKVVGTDISEAMIAEASSAFPAIEFRRVAAEDLDYAAEFDAVFCNSALQWFAEPDRALSAMSGALKPGGRLAVACPGTGHFSPFFEKVVAEVAGLPGIAPVFAGWRSPWFFLPDVESYASLFERYGLRTVHISIDREADRRSVDEAFGVYTVGASMGYANPAYYDCDVPAGYVDAFNRAVRDEMERVAVDGRVLMEFNRLYYVGEKT